MPGAVDPWAQIDEALMEEGISESEGREEAYMAQTQSAENQVAYEELALSTQAELLEGLSVGSSVFKVAISSENTLRMIGESLNNTEADSFQPSLHLPWPPGEKSARRQLVSWSDFQSGYLNQLPKEELKLLKEKSSKLVNENNKLFSALSAPEEVAKPQLTEKMVKRAGLKIYNKKKQTERFTTLVSKAKKYLVEELKARPLIGGAEAQRELVNKIEAVSFGGVETDHEFCLEDSSNAFYDHFSNSFFICSGNSVRSDLAVISTIGHELGHAIDPCGCRLGVHQVNPAANQSEIVNALKAVEYKNDMEKLSAQLLSERAGQTVSAINLDFSEETLRQLEEIRMVTARAEGIKGAYPFDTTFRCLRDRHKFSDGSSMGHTFKDAQRKRRGKPSLEDKLAENRDLRSCSSKIIENSEMTEAMADVFGAKVLGRYALEHKSQPEDLASALDFGLRIHCEGTDQNPSRPYPSFSERLEKIVLSEPLVAKAFSCNLGSDSVCMKKFGHLPQMLNTQTTTPQTPVFEGEEAVK